MTLFKSRKITTYLSSIAVSSKYMKTLPVEMYDARPLLYIVRMEPCSTLQVLSASDAIPRPVSDLKSLMQSYGHQIPT